MGDGLRDEDTDDVWGVPEGWNRAGPGPGAMLGSGGRSLDVRLNELARSELVCGGAVLGTISAGCGPKDSLRLKSEPAAANKGFEAAPGFFILKAVDFDFLEP